MNKYIFFLADWITMNLLKDLHILYKENGFELKLSHLFYNYVSTGSV